MAASHSAASEYFAAHGSHPLSHYLRHDFARAAAWHGAVVIASAPDVTAPRTEHGVLLVPLDTVLTTVAEQRASAQGKRVYVIVQLPGDGCEASFEQRRHRMATQGTFIAVYISL